MTFTRRARRDWRIFLWVNVVSAIVSACYGILVVPTGASRSVSALIGVVTSMLIATPIVLFELRNTRVGALRRLRRLPLVLFFAIKIAFYFVVIVGGLLLVRFLFLPLVPYPAPLAEGSIVFAVAMTVIGNLAFEMGGLLGFGTLKNILTGRYVQPKREQKVFLLIDMRDSTGLAERLGAIRFHELLNAFFRDISDAALECGAEIHKYVGDEAILTWPDDRAMAGGECLSCPFVARDIIASNSERYRRRFGIVPDFRASMHRGDIVAGEIGDLRREIAYVGDTLNVAARLLDASKTLGRDVLVSADLLQQTTLPSDLAAEPLPTLAVRGRNAPLEIFALARR